MVHYELDISLLGPCFDDPNSQKLALGVVNLPSKFQLNPTVKESGIEVLVRLLY
jgi:hypothetical protein